MCSRLVCHLDTHIFGPRAAEYFLGAWLMGSLARSEDEHEKNYKPSRAEVREFRDTYGQVIPSSACHLRKLADITYTAIDH